MKAIKGASIFRIVPWSKIHPPLPRTPRESKQLLNALTSSFRRQLDHEHPTSHSNQEGNDDRSPENPNSSVHATDKHLRTILENPLFRVVPSKSALPREQPVIEERLAKEPMVVFDELAASGSVTVHSIRDCLKSQLLLGSRHTGPRFVQAMKDSQAGSKVVSWWFASDHETRKMLFKLRHSTMSLLKFMVAEGLQDTVFIWLTDMVQRDPRGWAKVLPKTVSYQIFSNLLLDLMTAEIQYGRGLSAAMQYYVQAHRTIKWMNEDIFQMSRKQMLVPAGTRLCQCITQSTAREIHASTYEQFTEIISMLLPMTLTLATLPLYHPTHPDPRPFLRFMDERPPGQPESWDRITRDRFMRAGVDTLHILIDQGKFRDASHLASLMQQPEKADQETANQVSAEGDMLTRLGLAFT